MQCVRNQASKNWSFELSERRTVKEITIRHGFIVDAIQFTILDGAGFTFTTDRYGGDGGRTDKIVLKPNEIVCQLSGTLGHYQYDGKNHVSSLKIHTNLNPNGYGPYGLQKGTRNNTRFTTPYGIVAGFYGAAGQYLDHISNFIKPGEVVKFGPWGNQGLPNWEMKLGKGDTIRELTMYYGYLIDAIKFKVEDKCGRSTIYTLGTPQASWNVISLQGDEYITRISGKQGVYAYDNQRHIGSITIHTNLCPDGYGPYGLAQDMENISGFSSPTPTNYKINGFFGKHGCMYIDSIGVSMTKIQCGC